VVLDYWSLDEEDSEFAQFPSALQAEMRRDFEDVDASAPIFEPLILRALRDGYRGVRNEYLRRRLEAQGMPEEVTGESERMFACPCCGYLCLPDGMGWEICGVCFWEDTGTGDLDAHSGPNHMSLREGQANFARLGAIDERALPYVLADGRERYEKA